MSLHKLPKNGVIAITSPSSPVVPERLERGVRYLEQLGYRVKIGASCYASDTYFAGSAKDRADELNRFFADPDIDAIFCGRGGFGSMYMLPYLDYSSIQKSATLFVGFSDVTALQWAIWKMSNLPTISAGMVATDMANEPVNPVFEEHFWKTIESGSCNYVLDHTQTHMPSHTKEVHGIGLPGTLAVAAKIIATPWFPSVKDSILILEDVDEPAHKVDGYLGNFRLAGFFEQAAGVVLGAFTPVEKEPYPNVPNLDQIIDRVFDGIQPPLARHVPYGHIKTKIAVPVGLPICVSSGDVTRLYNPVSLYAI